MRRYPTAKIAAAVVFALALAATGLAIVPQGLLVPPLHAPSTQQGVASAAIHPGLGATSGPGPKAVTGSDISASLLSTPQLLGSVKRQDNGIKAASPNSTWRITLAEDANGFGYDIGNYVPHHNGITGTYNFTVGTDVDFRNVSALLTNGVDDPMEFVSSEKPVGAANWSIGNESSFFNTTPDFLGYAIDSYCLVVHDLHIYQADGTALEFANYTWQVWGHRIFVAFAPPSDPNGIYLFDRDFTNVSVSLAGDGDAFVEWDGVNRTMLGAGRSWYLNVTSLPNGDHEYRVWANDTNGTLYSSEVRHITIAFHYWSIENIGAGSGPSLATDHNGITHLCYEDSSGFVRYGTDTSTGWSVQTVAFGGAGYCSMALDPAGNPHLLFGSLKYAVLGGSTWAVTTITNAPVTRGASLALNPVTGRPMAAFYDGASNEHHLVFEQQVANGSWSSLPVDRNGDTGWMPSIVVNSTGIPAIAYSNSVGDILYANLTGGTWRISVINKSFPMPGLGKISLALDSHDMPHVAYTGGGPRYGTVGYIGLEYASLKGANWTNETIYPGPTQGVSLAFDAQDRPHIAFGLVGYPLPANGTLRDLRYAAWNGTWHVAVLSNTSNTTGIALTLGAGGVPQIAATSWWNGGGADQGTLDFFTITIGLFATFEATPPAGKVSTVFTFDPRASYDTYFASSTLQARWDFNGDGAWDTSWLGLVPVQHQYSVSSRYTVSMQLRDPSNVEALVSRLVVADSQPPVTAASLTGTAGSGGWYTSAVTVTLTATDNLSEVASTAYRLDGGAWTTYAAPIMVSANGANTLQYYSVDTVGNVEPTRTTSFEIDTGVPSTTAMLSGTLGTAGWYVSAVQVTLNASEAVSGIASIFYRIDGGTWQTYGSPFSIGEGNHTVQYYSVDVAGNPGLSGTSSVPVDTTAPTVVAGLSGTLGNQSWYRSAVGVTLTASDALSGVASISVSVNGTAWQTFNGGTYTGSFGASGSYAVTYYATDLAGNPGPHQEVSFKVDSIAPVLANLEPSGSVITSTVAVSWTGSDSGSGIAGYQVSVDGKPVYSGTATSTKVNLPDGDHTIVVLAFDVAGNSAEVTTHVHVDTSLFSFYGPFFGLPTVAVIVALLLLGLILFLLYRDRKSEKEPPT